MGHILSRTARVTLRANGSNVLVNSPYVAMIDNITVEGGSYVTVEGFIAKDAPRNGTAKRLRAGTTPS